MEERTPLMYLIIHEALIRNYKFRNISKVELFNIFSRYFRVKKVFWHVVLKEMENYNLIIYHLGRHPYIEINKPVVNLENTSHIYKSVGLF